MKTITIRLPDVEEAMLVEVQKVNRAYRDLQAHLLQQIRQSMQHAACQAPRAGSQYKSFCQRKQCPAHHATCRRGIPFTSP
jgi:hypothetical protein